MATLTYSGTLVIETCWCGMPHAIPQELRNHQWEQKQNGKTQDGIYCPAGHKWIFKGTSQVDRLKQELELANKRALNITAAHDQTKAALRETELSLRGTKAAKTRIKNRIAKGVCPCCNRYFKELDRHMHDQHPEFTATDE